MIESIMWFGIGFLFAVLVALAVVPLIHARAVRLTIRRLENAMPQSMAELQADKDLLRAEFAMSMRQLEIRVEQLKDSNTRQRADLSKKDDIINRLKIDRETHNIEDILLKAEVATLKERFAAAGKEMKVAQSRREPELASTLPHRYAESALTVAPADARGAASGRFRLPCAERLVQHRPHRQAARLHTTSRGDRQTRCGRCHVTCADADTRSSRLCGARE